MFQVWVLASGERTFASNGKQYNSLEAAKEAGTDLFRRWWAVEKWAVLPVGPKGYLTQAEVVESAVYQDW